MRPRTPPAWREILENPGEVVKILEDCRDKKGKIDEKKAYIKLIDAFTLSIYTAKKLYGYHLEQGKDMSGEIASLRAKVDSARKSQTLNENLRSCRAVRWSPRPGSSPRRRSTWPCAGSPAS